MGKGFVQADISTIIEKLAKDVKFLQPVYEAITNSLEAGAKNIVLSFDKDFAVSEELSKITGFSITDDGEGFTENNRKAFVVLWTKNKLKLGCKGSGRFTWLSVFEHINIKSSVGSENCEVEIPFSLDFKADDIVITDKEISKNETVITFSNVTKDFYCIPSSDRKIVDKRCIADLNFIKSAIIEYLLIRLFLVKKNHGSFNITLKLGSQVDTITTENIPNLDEKTFSIYSNVTRQDYKFTLFYKFTKDEKNSKKVYYCANNRATKQIDDDALGFSCALPNKDSFIMLLCSDYFNDKDNDTRDDLVALSNRKQASIDIPLLYSDINPEMKRVMHEIILETYPEIHTINDKEEEKAIEAAPYLAAFIKKDSDIIKSEKSLIIRANEYFSKAKNRAQENFKRVLSAKTVSNDEFEAAVGQLSLIAAAELGEYIYYRNSIIKALESAIIDPAKKENFIHNIFMPMRTTSHSTADEKHLLSNLWLLDDKFMTYSYAASDETVDAIKADIEEKNEEKFKDKNRPDITIFFNSQGAQKNVVVIEFKGANASKYEKKKALTELPDDVAIIKKHIPNITTIWSYIITSIDDEFKFSIENQEGYIELFTAESASRSYYKYFSKQNAHEFILDLKAITSDAFARNKVFMDILKKQ